MGKKYKLFLIEYIKLGFNYESIWAKSEKSAIKCFKTIHPNEVIKSIIILKSQK